VWGGTYVNLVLLENILFVNKQLPEHSSVVNVMLCHSVGKDWIPQLHDYETLKNCEHLLFERLIGCAF
jgi:hypothetical protein